MKNILLVSFVASLLLFEPTKPEASNTQPEPDSATLLEKVVETNSGAAPLQLASTEEFPLPNGFENRVRFWIDIYAKYPYDQILVHGIDNLVVYDVVDFTGEEAKFLSDAARRTILKKSKEKYSGILRSIFYKQQNNEPLNAEEQRIAGLVKGNYLYHAENIRLQNGQKDRFEEGLRRSGKVMYKIKEVLKEEGLPEKLMYLPHVESSFNYEAYSSVGAAGIWQFMKSTGRDYMTIQYYLDERRDPFTATHAAAKLLKSRYEALGTWPLALTAYNHGLNGMMRARNQVGTTKLDQIVERYVSKSFGFASKNFYAEFLAASHVAENYKTYFGEIEFEKPMYYDEVPLKRHVNIYDLSKNLQLPISTLQEYNPSFKDQILRGQKLIPAGYVVKTPRAGNDIYGERYAKMPDEVQHDSQVRDTAYQVQKGDTLSGIARMYGVSVKSLQQANSLKDNRIKLRQLLIIPASGKSENLAIATTAPVQATSSALAVTPAASVVSAEKTSPPAAASTMILIQPEKNVALTVKPEPEKAVAGKETVKGKENGFFRITVGYDENIGLFAEWAKTSSKEIQKLNKLRKASGVQLGRSLNIPASSVNETEFQEKRQAYHKEKESSFLARNVIEKVNKVKLTSGDTVWKICTENNVPLWLLQKHNPNLDMKSPLPLGTEIEVPVLGKSVASAK